VDSLFSPHRQVLVFIHQRPHEQLIMPWHHGRNYFQLCCFRQAQLAGAPALDLFPLTHSHRHHSLLFMDGRRRSYHFHWDARSEVLFRIIEPREQFAILPQFFAQRFDKFAQVSHS
jgi:hypothetical protein